MSNLVFVPSVICTGPLLMFALGVMWNVISVLIVWQMLVTPADRTAVSGAPFPLISGTSRIMKSLSLSVAELPVPCTKLRVMVVLGAGLGLIRATATGKKSQMLLIATDIPATACLASACDAPRALSAKR